MDDVPTEVTRRTGLLSWPDRGSAMAHLVEGRWRKPEWILHQEEPRVTLTYESQDALWCVEVIDRDGYRSAMLRRSAETAWTEATEQADDLGCVLDPDSIPELGGVTYTPMLYPSPFLPDGAPDPSEG